jgi:4-hydroxybutyryl-CoA dehydratase/vinylacetyl-CoA-Delta-isomerase
LQKYLKGREDISTEDRIRILRLIENMTLGRNAVGYLTESMHGAGSPQAQRVQMARHSQLDFRKELAKTLAGITDMKADDDLEMTGYLERVFKPEPGDQNRS